MKYQSNAKGDSSFDEEFSLREEIFDLKLNFASVKPNSVRKF